MLRKKSTIHRFNQRTWTRTYEPKPNYPHPTLSWYELCFFDSSFWEEGENDQSPWLAGGCGYIYTTPHRPWCHRDTAQKAVRFRKITGIGGLWCYDGKSDDACLLSWHEGRRERDFFLVTGCSGWVDLGKGGKIETKWKRSSNIIMAQSDVNVAIAALMFIPLIF